VKNWFQSLPFKCNLHRYSSGVDPRLVLSDTRILDVLLHNSDRHSGGALHVESS
jgi:hypothetical protein